MENVLIAAYAVLPTIIILVIGHVIKKFNILKSENVGGLNTAVANIFLPCLTSSMVLKLDENEMSDFPLLLFSVVCTAIIALFCYIFRKFYDKNEKTSISIVITRTTTNCIILGGSVAMSLYGEIPPIIGFITSVAATLMNCYAILILEFYKNKNVSFKTIISIFSKPIVYAVVISFIIKCLSIKLPDVIIDTITTLGKATLPVSLISLGVFFDFGNFGNSFKKIMKICVVHYAIGIIVFFIAILLGFRNERLASLLFTFMASTAVAAYPLSAEYDMDTKIVGNILVLSTILSIVVFSISIYVLKELMFI